MPYDQLLLALGSVSRTLPVPGLNEHAVGFKGLADAIYLRNHVIETLEEANATDDPARREKLLTYVFVGGGYAGLEALAELQDFAADAMDSYPRARLHGMRWMLVEAADRVLPEIDLELADYALRELRGRGIDIRLSTHAGRGHRRHRARSRPVRRCRPKPWSGPPASPRSRSSKSSTCRSTSAAASRSTSTCGSRGWTRSGRSATAPPLPTRAAAPPADRPARGPPGPGRRPQHRRRARDRHAAAVRLPRLRRLRQPRPLQGGRAGSATAPSAASPPGGWPAATT